MVEENPTAVEPVPTKTHKVQAVLTLPSGAKVLHTKCRQVKEITPAVKALAQALEDYLKAHRRAELRPIGIAAPQLGKSIRMFSCVLNVADDDCDTLTIINPELAYEKKLHFVRETCLSIPGRAFMLKRGKIVKIRGTTMDGTIRSFKGHDIVAQMFLHELNHLDGVTIDTLGPRVA